MTQAAADDDDDGARADVGIVCALPLELQPFLARCERVRKYTGGDFTFRGGLYDGIRIVVAESGTGRTRARRAAQALVDAHHPAWVLSCGFAGALHADVKIGQIVVADRLLALDRPPVQIDLKMPADPARGLHVGTLLTCDEIVRTIADKQTLAAKTGAMAVDMESHAVGEFCRDRQFRSLAVRVITDDLSRDLPPEVLSVFGGSGAVRFGAVVGALWKRPSSYQDLLQLREVAASAADRLADFLDGVVHQLHRSTASTGDSGR
jgi:adenosylhomocysteine nucleosidase